jgi:hypothetical protein
MPLYEKALRIKTWHYSKKNQGSMPCFPESTGQQLSYVFRYSYTVGQSRCASGALFSRIHKLGIADLRPRKLVIHGVGAMRPLPGRFLFDLDDPSKEIGRLKDPLSPREDEREGYVPNVVYLRFDYPQQQPYILCRIGLPPLMGGGYELMDALKKSK